MAVTNACVHEVDISRWLLEAEPTLARISAASGYDPLMITHEPDSGAFVSTEVYMNARYGYHVHAQLVGRDRAIKMAAPTVTLTNHAGQHGHAWPENRVPRFRDAYRIQMNARMRSIAERRPVGASASDGYDATAIAEQVVTALRTGEPARLNLGQRPDLCL